MKKNRKWNWLRHKNCFHRGLGLISTGMLSGIFCSIQMSKLKDTYNIVYVLAIGNPFSCKSNQLKHLFIIDSCSKHFRHFVTFVSSCLGCCPIQAHYFFTHLYKLNTYRIIDQANCIPSWITIVMYSQYFVSAHLLYNIT